VHAASKLTLPHPGHDKESMMMNRSRSASDSLASGSRRSVIELGGIAAVLAVAASFFGGQRGDLAPIQSGDQPEPKNRHQGYRLSEHVGRYYRSLDL
jgi:hypothetical protein